MKTTISKNLRAAMQCAVGGTALCVLLCTAAAAEDPSLSRTVGYADLNITQMAGAKVLYRRIGAAARQVCEVGDARNLSAQRVRDICIKQAVDEAVKGVNSAALTALHAGHALQLASN